MYGYTSDQRSISAGKFGLNKATVTEFDYESGESKDGNPYECLTLKLNVDGKEYNKKFFPVTRAYFKKNKDADQVEITDETHPAMVAERALFTSIITNFLKCFATDEEIQKELSTSHDFKSYCDNCAQIFQDSADKEEPILVFLRWQWSPKGDNKKTFLEIPKNIKHGKVFAKNTDELVEVLFKETEDGETELTVGGEVVEFDAEEDTVTITHNDVDYIVGRGKYPIALAYIDATAAEFVDVERNGWYMGSKSKFSSKQDFSTSDSSSEEW